MRTHHLPTLLLTSALLSQPSTAQAPLPPLPAETTGSTPVQTTPGGAQVSLAQPPASPTGTTTAPAAHLQGNCKLMASNTLRVIYRGIVESGWGAAPAAHFIVIENLAHKSYAPEGDAALSPGTLVGVELRRDIPGQPASVADSIMAMRPGEEAVMRMDHLYMLDQTNYGDLRVCGRFQARMAQPASQAAGTGSLPYGINRPGPTPSGTTAAPTATPSTTRTTTGAPGEVSTKWEVDSQGHVRERIYVNGEEIQPPALETAGSTPATQPEQTATPATSPAKPDRVIPEDETGDDTIVETPKQPAGPVATPGTSTTITATSSTTATPTPATSPGYDPSKDSF